ncbi:MAG: 16S rRNA processing protein RimM [Acidisphaera sp.]|nr:16S rRNA processing protein RimM [Acidisphaera sp.]MBV9814083.1 16S rRNA processing protein RimM [Acetobacteraceae bacterium]
MAERRILMGMVGRPHGVRGLVRVQSFTADPADLASFYPLTDDRGRQFALRWASDGIAEIFTLDGGLRRKIADRDAASRLTNTRLFVERSQLPQPEPDEFYLADLIGMVAVSFTGESLGRVIAVHDYGAGASLEIGGRVVPFNRAVVPVVDLAGGRMIVVLPGEIDGERLPSSFGEPPPAILDCGP